MRQGLSNEVRYFGIFLATMGVHANTPAILAFNQTNTLDSAQRAASAGILIACGAMGSIIGSLIFRGQDGKVPLFACTASVTIWRCLHFRALVPSHCFESKDADEYAAPGYGPGIYTTIGLTTYMVFASCWAVLIYHRRNKAADRDGSDIQGVPGFRYAL